MNPFKNLGFRGSAAAFALTALALVVALVLEQTNLDSSVFALFILLPFLAAVWLSAWFWGRVGGFTATAASWAAMLLFFFFRPEPGVSPTFSQMAPPFLFAA